MSSGAQANVSHSENSDSEARRESRATDNAHHAGCHHRSLRRRRYQTLISKLLHKYASGRLKEI
jgi:hypothetical protein